MGQSTRWGTPCSSGLGVDFWMLFHPWLGTSWYVVIQRAAPCKKHGSHWWNGSSGLWKLSKMAFTHVLGQMRNPCQKGLFLKGWQGKVWLQLATELLFGPCRGIMRCIQMYYTSPTGAMWLPAGSVTAWGPWQKGNLAQLVRASSCSGQVNKGLNISKTQKPWQKAKANTCCLTFQVWVPGWSGTMVCMYYLSMECVATYLVAYFTFFASGMERGSRVWNHLIALPHFSLKSRTSTSNLELLLGWQTWKCPWWLTWRSHMGPGLHFNAKGQRPRGSWSHAWRLSSCSCQKRIHYIKAWSNLFKPWWNWWTCLTKLTFSSAGQSTVKQWTLAKGSLIIIKIWWTGPKVKIGCFGMSL